MHARLIVSLCAFLLIGGGCFAFREQPQTPEQEATAIASAFLNASTTFGEAGTSTSDELRSWDTQTLSTTFGLVSFTPPEGYWVYASPSLRQYWLVKGSVPEPGSDALQSVRGQRVATMNLLTWNPKDIPTWERFEMLMAQFRCMEGETSEELIVCSDRMSNVVEGETPSGFRYRKFTLPRIKNIDRTPIDEQMVLWTRFGATSKDGLLILFEDPSALGASIELIKSLSST